MAIYELYISSFYLPANVTNSQQRSQTCALIIKFSHLYYFVDFQSLRTELYTYLVLS